VDDEKGFDFMNVIPLVDIMLVLLTIVLMTSTFVASGAIPVQLPRASQQNRTPLKAATVTIDREGNIYFESVPTTLGGLQEHLKDVGREVPVAVKADRSVAVQACVDVLDTLSGTGFRKVSLQTERAQ
jgi:biopolymer transport protein ExbD